MGFRIVEIYPPLRKIYIFLRLKRKFFEVETPVLHWKSHRSSPIYKTDATTIYIIFKLANCATRYLKFNHKTLRLSQNMLVNSFIRCNIDIQYIAYEMYSAAYLRVFRSRQLRFYKQTQFIRLYIHKDINLVKVYRWVYH